MTKKALLKEAKKLSLPEREKLAYQLLVGVERELEDAPLSEDLKAELDRRMDVIEASPRRGTSIEDVMRDYDRRIKPARRRKCAS
ncbi:MAG TPA: addiction module protein [Planctomycetota bacterium]